MSTTKAPPGHFTLLYFAGASSFTKRSHDHLPAPMSLGHLVQHLENQYPGITAKILSSCAITVNLDYVDMDDEKTENGRQRVVGHGDEVALIPPVSSG